MSYSRPLVRVYLLDDHDIVRRGLRDLLAPSPDIQVVGDSGSVRSAHEAVLGLTPDVMLLDLQLQDGSGIEVCRRVRSVAPSIRGIILTAAGDDDALVATVLAGAEGYVVKVVGAGDIADAVRRVGGGRPLLDTRQRARGGDLVLARASSLRPGLRDLELDLVGDVVSGSTDAEIAERRGMALEEVRPTVLALSRRLVTGTLPTDGPDLPTAGGKHRRD